jgi:PhnB protein
MKLTTSVSFNGQCEAAFEFYAKQLGGKIEYLLRWGESPMVAGVSADWHDKILYARLTLGASEFVGADIPPQDYKPPQGFSVLLGVGDIEEAERVFDALAAGGTVMMPLEERFWSVRYGVVVDRFGIPWDVNCERAPQQRRAGFSARLEGERGHDGLRPPMTLDRTRDSEARTHPSTRCEPGD